jgi:hypothetical protein
MRATTITAAMATMATVETAKSTRLCYPWGPFVKTYAATGTARARASATAVVRPLTNGAPAHVLTREERARGGRVRAANALARRSNLRHARAEARVSLRRPSGLGRCSVRTNLESAMWADEVIKRHILPETSKHTSGLAGWYSPRRRRGR